MIFRAARQRQRQNRQPLEDNRFDISSLQIESPRSPHNHSSPPDDVSDDVTITSQMGLVSTCREDRHRRYRSRQQHFDQNIDVDGPLDDQGILVSILSKKVFYLRSFYKKIKRKR